MIGERAVRITAKAMSSTMVSSAFLTTAKVIGSTLRWVMTTPMNRMKSVERGDHAAYLVGAHAPARRDHDRGVGAFENHRPRNRLVQLRARNDRRFDPACLAI